MIDQTRKLSLKARSYLDQYGKKPSFHWYLNHLLSLPERPINIRCRCTAVPIVKESENAS